MVSLAGEVLKENIIPRAPLAWWWLLIGIIAAGLALMTVVRLDHSLPEPLPKESPHKERFIADIAYEHLLNLTSIGPRVAGSYENEVLAVGQVVQAVRRIAAEAASHHRVQLDVHRASGAFAITFLDGMSNVYRDVQSVVVRLSAAAGTAGARAQRRALLLNCHIDTVPDSPGASDDGAGCAVVLEALRALAASPVPLPHDAVFLLNGAEENIMQASHAFITAHRWAPRVRAFINIEACGAGGREVLFQAGPHDPWIMEVYAGVVPHPFASSLAQELFESGLIPGDTDFRIFRDFGKLSGVDLAWNSNGYVYHTALDTVARVPRAALQRTGDNVLALAHGLLSSPSLESQVDAASRQPVFFDVLGACVVCVRAPAAAAAALAALALAAARVHHSAGRARAELYVSRGAWWACVRGAAWRVCAAHGCGAAAGAAGALALHAAGARLAFYTRAWLLAPLYAVPAVGVTWLSLLRLGAGPRWPLLRGWWAARAVGDAVCVLWALLLAAAALVALRSGFLPLLWVALPAAADLAAHYSRASEGARAAMWCAGAAVPSLQTWYMSYNWLNMFVPLTGRSGPGPADVVAALLVATLVLAACSWMLPFVFAIREPHRMIYVALAVSAVTALLVATTPLGAPYSPERPQRLMVFHTRRTVHAPGEPERADSIENFYWIPDLDVNTPHSVDEHVPEMRAAATTPPEECARWAYCGAPYYLPVLSFISRAHRLEAASAPLVAIEANVSRDGERQLLLEARGPAHLVLVVAPAAGARLVRLHAEGAGELAPQEGPAWGARRTYFVSLHDARPRAWRVRLQLEGGEPAARVQLSLAGHALAGALSRHRDHERLLRALPDWTAPTGWGVDMHIYEI